MYRSVEGLASAHKLHRVRLRAARRTQSITLIMALPATPLVLLAEGQFAGNEGCDRMCCLRHGHRTTQTQDDDGRAQTPEKNCNRGAVGHAMKCQMRANHSGNLSSPVAPIPPTLLSAGGRMVTPSTASEILFANDQKPSSGFCSPPFEPPRT